METQSQDTARMNRIEAARQAALGTLSRARETLQVAATTVPAWARGVELRAGETVDALLERVGLVRIAKVEAQRPAVETETAPAAVEPAVEAAVATTEEVVEASAETPAEEVIDASAEAGAETPAEAATGGDRSGRRRRC